jgi:hypothetical protein
MLILDVIVSGFAAWGVFCAAKFFADGFLTPKSARPRPTVILTGKESEREIIELCENARKAIVPNRGEILFLVPNDEVLHSVERLGLDSVRIVYEKKGKANEQ